MRKWLVAVAVVAAGYGVGASGVFGPWLADAVARAASGWTL